LKAAQLLDRRLLHQGTDLRISIDRVHLPNGNQIELEMIHHPGASAVVPFVTPDQILLVRQYRWATSSWIYEIPAGKLRPRESPEACARRELREEVGQEAGRLERLNSIWTVPGFSNERIHLFSAWDLTPVSQSHQDDECIHLVQFSLEEVFDLIRKGDLCDGKSLCAFLHLLLQKRAI